MARLIQLWESQTSTDLKELDQKINSFDKTTLEKKFVQSINCPDDLYYVTSQDLWKAWEHIEELLGWMEVLALRHAWRSGGIQFSDFSLPSTMGDFIRITQILPLKLEQKNFYRKPVDPTTDFDVKPEWYKDQLKHFLQQIRREHEDYLCSWEKRLENLLGAESIGFHKCANPRSNIAGPDFKSMVSFGSSASPPKPTGFQLGSSASPPKPTGLFGSSASQLKPAGLFGSSASPPKPTGLFGSSASPPKPTGFQLGSSASPPKPTGLFGSSASQLKPAGLFGSSASPPKPTGLFGSSASYIDPN
ncbi:hypothetical protein B0T10DRAFT_561515 [Thelonectria olida]|uniref:Uncharacterized protein n=1 Tax=Thelonectria olida TaxID=1576542 RepID=A0A9P9AQ87_9HYPO|nr:hypothetical protein B0T10DRAFT_561515 [Thelonectria olida]